MGSLLFLILMFVAFLGVVRAIVEVRKTYKCPSDERLRKVFKGLERNESVKDQITRHLGVCEKCRDKIGQLNS